MRIIDVIQYEGDNKTFIWKHPREDFNIGSQLIVHESQEAIFFRDGKVLDLFTPGRFTLETENLPLLSRLLSKFTGGENMFHCEIYFINKVEQMAIKWGTDSKVQYIEPTYQFPLAIGASGELSLRVADSRRLLSTLVGSEHALSQEKLAHFFRGYLMTKVKSYIAKVIKEKQINIFEIDEHLDSFSCDLRGLLQGDFGDYGMSLERFYITNVVRPDGERQYEQFKELHYRQYADVAQATLRQQVDLIDQHTRAQKIVLESQAIAQKRQQEGYSYQDERGFDVAEQVAANDATGGIANVGIGLGMMAGVSAAVSPAVGGLFHQAVSCAGLAAPSETERASVPSQPPAGAPGFCDQCGESLSKGASFCEECGAQAGAPAPACPGCGFVFERDGKFCPKCGAKRS